MDWQRALVRAEEPPAGDAMTGRVRAEVESVKQPRRAQPDACGGVEVEVEEEVEEEVAVVRVVAAVVEVVVVVVGSAAVEVVEVDDPPSPNAAHEFGRFATFLNASVAVPAEMSKVARRESVEPMGVLTV